MGSPRSLLAVSLVVLASLCGCFPSVDIPDGAQLSCAAAADCPTGWVCNQNLSRCVQANALDTAGPTLTGGLVLTPDTLRRGATSQLSLDVSEPLLGVPEVSLQTTPARPFTLDAAASSAQHFVFSYLAGGDEPTGVDVPVSIGLVDLSGNSTSVSGSLQFDFTTPEANAIAVTGTPATAGATVRIAFTASEPLGVAPQLSLGTLATLIPDPAVVPPNYAFDYVVTGAEPEGAQVATLHLSDRAGNLADLAVESPVAFDFTAPQLAAAGEVVTPAVRESFTALVRLTVSEPLAQAPSVTLDPGGAGTPIALTVGEQVGLSYTFEHRVAAADPDGVYTVRLGALEDLAHNSAPAQVLGTLAIDTQAPALSGAATLDKPDPRYRSGDVVTLRFDATEPLAFAPHVRLTTSPAPRDFACVTSGAHSDCTLTVLGSEPEGPTGITIELQDVAGNIGFATTTLVLDFTPPFPVGGDLQLLPADTNLVRQVTAVTGGTRVQVNFGMSEPVVGPISVATTTPQALSFQFLPVAGNVFGYLCAGTEAPGSYDLRVTATDRAGNVGTAVLNPAAFTVDLSAPAAPLVAVPDKVIYHRNPFGSTASAGSPTFSLELKAGSVVPDATVIVYDGPNPRLARELGRASPPAAGQAVATVPLDLSDRSAVYALTVDGAGNSAAAAVEVKDVEWVATLGGKLPGSTYENPTGLVLAPTLLAMVDHRAVGASEPSAANLATLARADGSGFAHAGQGLWRERTFGRASPSRRTLSGMALDPVRGKLVLFGAGAGVQLPGNDTWELDLFSRTWLQRSAVTATPSPRWGHALVGTGGGTVYLFGGGTGPGAGSSQLNDVWAWEGSAGTWSPLPPTSGTSPLARQQAQVAHDRDRNKLIVFGGDAGSNGLQADLWEFDLATRIWTNRTPGTLPPSWPAARSGGLLVPDPLHQRLLLVGGSVSGAGGPDVWELDPATATWTARGPTPWTANQPGVQGALDPASNLLVVLDPTSGATAGHLYRYDPATFAWADVTPAPLPAQWPTARSGAAVAQDPLHGGLVFFGGNDLSGLGSADTWFLSAALPRFVEWTPTAPGAIPSERWSAAWAFDSQRDKLLIFGGRQPGSDSRELWEWDASATTWTNRTPASLPGSWPLARVGAAMAYDPVRQRMLLFGGSITGTATNTLEELDPATGTWRMMSYASGGANVTPTARVNPVVVFDPLPVPGKLYLLGGTTALGSATGVPEFTSCTFDASAVATCANAPLTGAPPTVFAELAGAFGIDALTGAHRLVVFGGQPAAGPQLQELREFNGTSWALRSPTGPLPPARSRASLAFSPARNKFLLFGGYKAAAPSSLLADAWEWDSNQGAFAPVAVGAAAPVARDRAVLGFSPVEEAFTVFGGALASDPTSAPPVGDTWELLDPGGGRPAAIWTVPFGTSGAPTASTLQSVMVQVKAAGSGTAPAGTPVSGAALLLWNSRIGSWLQVASTPSGTLPAAAPMSFTLADPTTIGDLFQGPQRTVAVAAAPLGFNRTGRSLASVLLDSFELTLRYRRP